MPMAQSNFTLFSRVSLSVILLITLSTQGHADPASLSVDFQKQIRSILSDNCYHCHGPDEKTREADLRLDVKDAAFTTADGRSIIAPGKPDESELIRRILSTDPEEQMPPPKSGRKLSSAQIELLRDWVSQGAVWKDHWAFVPPVSPTLPAEAFDPRASNPIDAFVLARLNLEKLSPSPTAPREKLIRRLTLDLNGLPPTLHEIDDYLADSSADAADRVIDRLMASPRYGEQMAVPWLDAARYADTNGYQNDGTRTMWPWRDWLINALNANIPFDRFTKLQLAGDLLPEASSDELVATGFHRNHMLNGEGGRIAEESRVEYCVDRVDTTSTVWLGLTMGCSRCHDHKYDPFTQKDYYSLYGYFNNIEEVGSVDRGGNANPVIKMPTPEQNARRDEIQKQIAALEEQLRQEPDLSEPARLAWEKSLKHKVEETGLKPRWKPLVPNQVESTGAAETQTLADFSVFVTGANPEKDNYRITAPVETSSITALRVEAIPHPDFTNGGFARSDSGNFVLTNIKIVLHPPNGEPIPLKIASAVADFEQGGHPVRQAFDDQSETGWAVYSDDMKTERQAVFTFDQPTNIEPGTTIEITLEHQSRHKFHNLGRFRLSVTSESQPSLPDNDIPDYVVEAVGIPAVQRSTQLTSALNDYFKESATKRPDIRRTLDQAKKDLSSLEEAMTETMVLKDREKPRETYVLIRGQYDNPDKSQLLEPRVPTSLGQLPSDAPKNRLSLVHWLTDAKNPLTARVAVNRWWQQFFGLGLVRTTEDFGSQGELPSHQELLDWLAVELPASGWDVKGLHRLIVSSYTYQQDSKVSKELVDRDPENRLLTRGPRYRMGSLALRDQAIDLAGLYVDMMGGPGVNPYQPANIWTDFSLGKIKYEQDKGASLYRRSIYTFWRRSVGPSMFFDTSTRQFCTVRPQRTNTPLQALTMLNDTTFVEAARVFAERILKESSPEPEARLRMGFRLATARTPKPEELDILLSRLGRAQAHFQANEDKAKELLAVGDRPAESSISPAELAAYAVVMNVIMNLDEVVTKE
jgi:mono/diheme cytochrome c family protein